MRAIGRYLHANLLGALALFVALGGTGYAAIAIPRNSVGSQQLRNHSITPAKFDRRFINGNIRAWVVAKPDGSIEASAGRPILRAIGGAPGAYAITWRNVSKPSQRSCFAMSGLTEENLQGGTADASLGGTDRPGNNWVVGVSTFNAQGQRTPAYFYAAVVC
jgi:hypothetical protein